MKIRPILLSTSLFLALLSGCEEFANSPQPQLETSTSPAVGVLFDASKKIETRVFEGGSILAAHAATATATVQSGWVLVGGGCKTSWSGTSGNGATLIASFPNQDKSTWTCKSKDHVYPQTHMLKAFAIGMRISGISEANLRNLIQVRPSSGQHSSSSTASAAILPGEILLGGGASIENLSTSAGALLTASYPQTNLSAWIAKSKDTYAVCAHTAVAYSITMPKSAFGMNFSSQTSSNSIYAPALTHTYDASIIPDATYALTSVGAAAEADDPYIGRFIFSSYPAISGASVFASSKDVYYPMGGNTRPYWIGIKRI